MILSPGSRTHLAKQGRYGISWLRFFGWNGRFCLLLFALDGLVLFGFEYVMP